MKIILIPVNIPREKSAFRSTIFYTQFLKAQHLVNENEMILLLNPLYKFGRNIVNDIDYLMIGHTEWMNVFRCTYWIPFAMRWWWSWCNCLMEIYLLGSEFNVDSLSGICTDKKDLHKPSLWPGVRFPICGMLAAGIFVYVNVNLLYIEKMTREWICVSINWLNVGGRLGNLWWCYAILGHWNWRDFEWRCLINIK